MEKVKSPTGIEQYLAIAAGLHHIVAGMPRDAYPIRGWGHLLEAVNIVSDVEIIIPGGEKKSLIKELLKANVVSLRPILGDHYFPIEDQRDFACKAGLTLVTLVMRHFGSPSLPQSLDKADEKTVGEIEAFKESLANLKEA